VPPDHPEFGRLLLCACQASARLARLADLSGLKAHERAYRLADLVAFNAASRALIQQVEAFIASPRGWLWLWGAPGNGKTLALQVAINETLARGYTAIYTTCSDLLDMMRATFDPGSPGDETFIHRFRRLQDIQVLAIDEFDKVNQTEFVREFRTKLVDHRYRDAIGGDSATLFASNDDPAHLPDWIADRVHDGRFKVFHNAGRSVRAAKKWDSER
jgi:DNA replication protein DnaC